MGSIVTAAGTFSDASPAGADLNPYVDPAPWYTLTIGGLAVPGTIVNIDGDRRPENWAVQMGISVSGAVTVWRGTKIAEAIKIDTVLFDRADVAAYYTLRNVLRPKLGRKPPAHALVNAKINFNAITRISVVDISSPSWNKADGSWLGNVILIQYSPPKPVAAGTVEPPKPTAEDPANVAAEQKLSGLLDRIAQRQAR